MTNQMIEYMKMQDDNRGYWAAKLSVNRRITSSPVATTTISQSYKPRERLPGYSQTNSVYQPIFIVCWWFPVKPNHQFSSCSRGRRSWWWLVNSIRVHHQEEWAEPFQPAAVAPLLASNSIFSPPGLGFLPFIPAFTIHLPLIITHNRLDWIGTYYHICSLSLSFSLYFSFI